MAPTEKRPILARRLKPLSRIGLVAPAGPLRDPGDLKRAEAVCQALGWIPVLFPHVGGVDGYLAGTDADRLADLNTALGDPSLDAVWCIRGGYGLTRLLDRVDYQAFAAAPKVVLGYSDVTALLLALHARTGVVTLHGPVARSGLSPFTRAGLLALVSGESLGRPLDLPPDPEGWTVPRNHPPVALRAGMAEGPLLGGNLTLLCCLIGTPFLPDLDGAILFLEDVGEPVYSIDRKLSHLRLAGHLDRLAGVAVGHFTQIRPPTDPVDSALPLDRVLTDFLGSLGVPVVRGLPIGHIDDQWTLPLGVRARLDAGTRTLQLLEPAVR